MDLVAEGKVLCASEVGSQVEMMSMVRAREE